MMTEEVKEKHPGKLALLAPYTFVPTNSGGQRAILGYVRYLSAVWPTVCIGTIDNATLPEVVMVPLFTNHPSKYFDPRVGWRIRRYLQKENIRFLGLQHHYFGLLLRPFLVGLDVRVFVFSHNLEFQRWKTIGKWWWPLMKWTERYVYRWADAVFFISWHEAQEAPAVFDLPREKCFYAPFAIEKETNLKITQSRRDICAKLDIAPEEKLLLFFGPQSYAPNLEAVRAIIEKVHPILQEKAPFAYRILICGGGLSKDDKSVRNREKEGIHYLGFVPHIEDYVLACDVVLNPVNSGGGVKTKLVEAVALGKTVVSTATGARGVRTEVYGKKLIVVEDDSWMDFTNAVINAAKSPTIGVPSTFWDEYEGSHAVGSVAGYLKSEQV